MSYTSSAMLSRAQSSVAIAGATGHLGYVIAETLLTTFKPFFSRVVALTRNATSPKALALAGFGATVSEVSLDNQEQHPVDTSTLREALTGIDVVINVLGVTSIWVKDLIAEAAIEAGAKVYFPSEFGVDHRLNDFPGFDHPEWDKKRKHMTYATELAAKKGDDIKVIAVYSGLFLEDSLNPRFGIDVSSGTITSLGSRQARITFTSKVDIARAVAQLAILAMVSPASITESVPAHVRIAGCTRSAEEIARALSLKEVEVNITEEDSNVAKERLKVEYETGNIGAPAGYIRVLMGEGKLDFSQDNSNELVNPHERLWKWKKVEEVAKEVLT